MASVLNVVHEARIYNGKNDYVPSDKELMENNDSGMASEISDNFGDIAKAASVALSQKKNNATYHWSTKNKSFLRLYNDLHKMGIKNNKFFLRIYDKELMTIDPYSPILPVDLQLRVILECIINPWYFLREICRVPEDGAPIEVGGGTAYNIDRNNVACWYLFLNGIDHYQSKPRQRGKTVDCIARCNYAYHFGALATNMLFFNKDQQMAKMNLYRLKCQRDMLPSWMQMRTLMLDDGKLDRGSDNITTMRNPVTGNVITVMPRATSKDSAMKLGRGATAAIQYYDEFDFIPFNTEIINAASFAYARAAENAQKNSSVYGRIYSSTAGDLDSKDGEAAAGYIDHMFKWTDKCLDLPIEELRAKACGPKMNRVVYVEHSWKQLKCSIKWYEEMCGLVSFDQEVILREIELQRIHGSNQSPFKRSDIMYLIQNRKEPIEKIDLRGDLQTFNIYEKLNRNIPYILAIDPCEGLAQDNNAATFINPYTQAPAAEFQSPYISQPQFTDYLCEFMDKYCPKCMIVVENNRGREMLNCFLATKYRYQLYYDDGKLMSAPVDTTDPYGALKRAAYERQAYGFHTGSNRSRLFAILENLVNERKDILYSQYLVDDICGLIRKATGRVEAGPNKHDDNVMCYLIGLFVYYNADPDFLEGFGIVRGATAPPNEYDINGNLTDDAKLKAIKNLLPSLPDELKGIFSQVVQEQKSDRERYEEEIKKAHAINQASLIPSLQDPSEMRQAALVDMGDDSFWSSYDQQVVESNFEDEGRFDVDIDSFTGW